MNCERFFAEVSATSGISVKLIWQSEFVFANNQCVVWHCEVEIMDKRYRTNVGINATVKEYAESITRIINKPNLSV